MLLQAPARLAPALFPLFHILRISITCSGLTAFAGGHPSSYFKRRMRASADAIRASVACKPMTCCSTTLTEAMLCPISGELVAICVGYAAALLRRVWKEDIAIAAELQNTAVHTALAVSASCLGP